MSSYLSDFEHTKLDAHVYPSVVVETHYISDPASGRRRIPQTKVWKVERVLGRGGSGEVRLEFNADGDERRAVKRIWGNGTTLKREYEMELRALLEFSKPKYKQAAVFVEFYGWFEDNESVYLAMEHISLGDLEHNVPTRPGAIPEPEIRLIVSQILDGLKIMHLENFAHRDLKPQNILVCKGAPAWWIKLTDFGVSKRQTEDTDLRTQTGTRPYMAPEVLNYISDIDTENSGYTKAVDMWALGCIIHRLTSGVIPFPPGPSLGNFCNNQNLFPFHTIGLSTQGIALMRDLLQPHPSTRLDVQQALAHPWILNINKEIVTQSQQSELNSSTTVQSPWNTVTHAGLRSISSVSGIQEPSDPTLTQQKSDIVTKMDSKTENTATVFDDDGIDRPYSQSEAVGQFWLKQLDKRKYINEIYIAHLELPGTKLAVMLTYNRILLIKVKKLISEWDIPLEDIQTIGKEKTGVSLTLKGGVNGPFFAIAESSSRDFLYAKIGVAVGEYNKNTILKSKRQELNEASPTPRWWKTLAPSFLQ